MESRRQVAERATSSKIRGYHNCLFSTPLPSDDRLANYGWIGIIISLFRNFWFYFWRRFLRANFAADVPALCIAVSEVLHIVCSILTKITFRFSLINYSFNYSHLCHLDNRYRKCIYFPLAPLKVIFENTVFFQTQIWDKRNTINSIAFWVYGEKETTPTIFYRKLRTFR